MSNTTLPYNRVPYNSAGSIPQTALSLGNANKTAGSQAEAITKAASRQTYYTIRFLVDQDRVEDAYRAYAYFRWLDDTLDHPGMGNVARSVFVNRQARLVAHCYGDDQGYDASLAALTPEEQMLVDLVRTDRDLHSGLRAYIQHMMAVMTFDTDRRGKVVSGAELECYTLHLATAVTEALHYFIGHDLAAPLLPIRYLAAAGAHVVHMLRDTVEDAATGYFNIPSEYLSEHHLDPSDVGSSAYREWVRQRVELAKDYFRAGKTYLMQVQSTRCRFAAFAYMMRFKGVLHTIEQEDYTLRPTYEDCKGWPALLSLGWSTLPVVLHHS